jgi:glycosidase/MoaA/NifB/PqqE/SkfB family radical SAM enzyme
MRDAGAGWLEADFDLDVGTYEYKLRHADDDWRLDPLNPRTRCAADKRNSLLVVGGTDEPVLHAPARPYLYVADDGRLCVRAGLRRGHGDRLILRWDEGSGPVSQPMIPVGEEAEHLLMEAWLPGSGPAVDYLFALADGRLVGASGQSGQSFHVPMASLRSAVPDWWKRAVVYTVFVDRFRRRGGSWDDPSATDRSVRCGGDLRGVIEALPYLCDLGVTAVHLTPICSAPSVHRYDACDPRRVDPELGGEAALFELLAAARGVGLKVIVDVTVTHVHRSFGPFRDVADNGPESRYWDWFHIYAHPFGDGQRPGYRHYQKGQWTEPLLDTSNPEVQDYLVGTFVHWVRAGADGVRIDAAADVPVALCDRIRRAVRAVRRDAVVFGEVVPSHIERWTSRSIDAATDFGSHEAMVDWLVRESIDAGELAAELRRRRFRRGPSWSAIGFAGTHDQPRIATRTGDPARARLAQLMVLARAPVPMIYYGDEIGLTSDQPARAFEDSWPDRQPMPWSPASWDRETARLVREALALRRERAALGRGDELPVALPGAGPDTVAIRRQAGDDRIDLIAHRGDAPVELTVGGPAALLLVTGTARLDGGRLTLGPRSGVLLDRTPPRLDIELAAANRELALRAFADGLVDTPSLPTQLYMTATEACNLRCQHCITGAPARTREGRARELRPWVVDALGEAFAAADYVGFTHGGESLVARGFPALLRAIQRARRGRPGPDIHLVTNGMLLTEARAAELIELGVTSLMVSIDGATAATNDLVREGGKLATVVDHVRAAVALRDRQRADLRIGISTVVGRRNLAELADIGALALDLGVDWLKIEETYPATPFARRDLVRPSDAAVRDAVGALRDRLRGRPMVLVDHLAPPTGCRCDSAADPVLRAFRDADDYANRTRFAPCRAPWEIACVDPDGTVRAVDYARTPLGNLADADLLALWNGPVAQRARAEALARLSDDRRARCARL